MQTLGVDGVGTMSVVGRFVAESVGQGRCLSLPLPPVSMDTPLMLLGIIFPFGMQRC